MVLSERNKDNFREFCANMSDQDFKETSIKKLIDEKLCPAWVIQSHPAILGFCTPFLDTSPNSNGTIIQKNTDMDITEDITRGKLENFIIRLQYLTTTLNFGELVFKDLYMTDSWWMRAIGYLMAVVLSFIWIISLQYFAFIMVWISIGVLFISFSGLFGYSLYEYILIGR